MGGNNKYQSTIGQNHSRRLGGIITAGACVPIILQSRLQKVKALVLMLLALLFYRISDKPTWG